MCRYSGLYASVVEILISPNINLHPDKSKNGAIVDICALSWVSDSIILHGGKTAVESAAIINY